MSSHRRYIEYSYHNYYIIIHKILYYYLSLILVTSKKSQDYTELENIKNYEILWNSIRYCVENKRSNYTKIYLEE